MYQLKAHRHEGKDSEAMHNARTPAPTSITILRLLVSYPLHRLNDDKSCELMLYLPLYPKPGSGLINLIIMRSSLVTRLLI